MKFKHWITKKEINIENLDQALDFLRKELRNASTKICLSPGKTDELWALAESFEDLITIIDNIKDKKL